MRKVFLFLGQILSPKTLYFNFKYLPFHQAVKLPFFITIRTCLLETKGKVTIEGPVYPGMIRIGFSEVGVFDKRYNRAIWEVRGNVHFEGNALFKFGSRVSVGENASLHIGKDFRLSPDSKVICFHRVKFGHNVRISWESTIMDTDFHKILTLDGEQINPSKPIAIGDNVWIGMRVTILKGVNIQSDNIIASNSYLNKSIDESFSIIGGHPAKVLRRNVTWSE